MDILDCRNHLCDVHSGRLLRHSITTASTRTEYAQYRGLDRRNSHHGRTRHASLRALGRQRRGLEHAMGAVLDRSLVPCHHRVRILAALPRDKDPEASFDEDVNFQEQEVFVGKCLDGTVLLVLQQLPCLCDVRTPFQEAAFDQFADPYSYWFQDYQGLSIIQTTLRFLPTGVTGIIAAFLTGHLLSSIRGDYILTFSTMCVSISSLLFAIPIPDNITYWAYGFPAMVLSVCGADTIFPVLTLFVAKTLPAEDASLGGALITAVGQIGRSIGLAIATATQTAIIARERNIRVDEVSSQDDLGHWSNALKVSIRGTAWLNFGMSLASTVVVLLFIRGIGVIGGKGKR
jgi:hypothetical protein